MVILGVSALNFWKLIIWTGLIWWICIRKALLVIGLTVWVDANDNMSISNHRRTVFHSVSIFLSFFGLEIYKAKTSMSPMILLKRVFPWKMPFYNLATVSKFINNVISCHLKIDIMNVNFEANIHATSLVVIRFRLSLMRMGPRLLHAVGVILSLWCTLSDWVAFISRIVSSIGVLILHLVTIISVVDMTTTSLPGSTVTAVAIVMIIWLRKFNWQSISLFVFIWCISVLRLFLIIWLIILAAHIIELSFRLLLPHIVVVLLLSAVSFIVNLLLPIRRRIPSLVIFGILSLASWLTSPWLLLFLMMIIVVIIAHIELWYCWKLVFMDMI